MATVRFSLSEWQKWIGDLKFGDVAMRGLRSGAQRALPILHRATENAPKASENGSIGAVNTGRYRRAWKTAEVTRGVRVFNTERYAPVIESGRRRNARRPPRDAIVRWAMQKRGMSRREAERAAFAIARSIGSRGLRARKVLKNSLPDIKDAVIDEVMVELRRELNHK